jgi:hypothetical protein
MAARPNDRDSHGSNVDADSECSPRAFVEEEETSDPWHRYNPLAVDSCQNAPEVCGGALHAIEERSSPGDSEERVCRAVADNAHRGSLWLGLATTQWRV